MEPLEESAHSRNRAEILMALTLAESEPPVDVAILCALPVG